MKQKAYPKKTKKRPVGLAKPGKSTLLPKPTKKTGSNARKPTKAYGGYPMRSKKDLASRSVARMKKAGKSKAQIKKTMDAKKPKPRPYSPGWYAAKKKKK